MALKLADWAAWSEPNGAIGCGVILIRVIVPDETHEAAARVYPAAAYTAVDRTSASKAATPAIRTTLLIVADRFTTNPSPARASLGGLDRPLRIELEHL